MKQLVKTAGVIRQRGLRGIVGKIRETRGWRTFFMRYLKVLEAGMLRIHPLAWPYLSLRPERLLTPNRGDILLRVDCLRQVLDEQKPIEETLYFQFAGDQDCGVVRNPYKETKRLISCVTNGHVVAAPRRVLVFRNAQGKNEYQVSAGEDELAAAIYLKRARIACRVMPYNPHQAPPDYATLIQQKKRFYIRCCRDAKLRETVEKIRQLHYGAFYTGDSDCRRIGLDAEGKAAEGVANFHSGARVVSRTRNFYQGLEALGILGERLSETRFAEYGLADFLTGRDTVLDLGCNTGFFALFMAGHAGYVRGIEANRDLVEIGNLAKSYLSIDNCDILCRSYETMERDQRFDLILSCNFHYYLNITAVEFMDHMLQLLNPGGYLLMEKATHIKPDLSDGDLKRLNNLAIPEVESLVRKGVLRIIRQGVSSSNRVSLRSYTLVQKSES